MTTPRVSVLMPVYNVEPWLVEAMDSTLAQTYRDFELICVDDGSKDGSLAILNDYARRDPRVRIISRPNTGLVGALIDALAAARGKYIARMDPDDVSLLGRFEKQVAFLDANPWCIGLGTAVRLTDPYLGPLEDKHPPMNHHSIDADLLEGKASAMVHATMMVRASAMAKAGGYRKHCTVLEELDLFLRLAEVGRLANLPDVLYLYRSRLTSVNFTQRKEQRTLVIPILEDAYRRRGLKRAVPPVESIGERYSPTPAEAFRNWALHAIRNGNLALARKHALSLMRCAPVSLDSWRVLLWSVKG